MKKQEFIFTLMLLSSSALFSAHAATTEEGEERVGTEHLAGSTYGQHPLLERAKERLSEGTERAQATAQAARLKGESTAENAWERTKEFFSDLGEKAKKALQDLYDKTTKRPITETSEQRAEEGRP